MSRTYRKPALVVQYGNAERYMKNTFWNRWKYVKVPKTKTQINREKKEALEDFNNLREKVAKKGGTYKPNSYIIYKIFEDGKLYRSYTFSQVWHEVRPMVVRGYYYVREMTDMEAEERAFRERFADYQRDGTLSETGQRKAFKKMAKRDLRRKNKEICKKAMRGEIEDDYPDQKDGKRFIWSVW